MASPASPRRLPVPWLWAARILWIAVFGVMVYLNAAVIMAHVERNASGVSGGAVGLRAEVYFVWTERGSGGQPGLDAHL